MRRLRTERLPAVLLLVAAAAGLTLANSPAGRGAIALSHARVGLPPLELSLSHWVSDGLLAAFFFVAAVELQVELTRGELRTARRAAQPAIAAAGGVVVPIAISLAIAGPSGLVQGWPVPTATDVAFALGVLAVFGRGLPASVRVFLLALAILDDLVGIVLIAVLFAHGLELGLLLLALIAAACVGVLSRMLDTRLRVPAIAGMGLLALATWVLVLLSGVHPTIAGVLLGLAMRQGPALRARHAMEPWVNGVVLPLFAFSAALVPLPAVSFAGLSPAFWAVLVALPLGKLVGISGAGWIAQRVLGRGTERLAVGDLLAVGALGGIGFTVSLLLADLAFAATPWLRDEATLGVLGGSVVAVVLSAIVVSWRARRHRGSMRRR